VLSVQNIITALIWYFCLLFSLCVHEAAHAAAAYRCGDPSAKFFGRMSLNPLAHIDPIGTVLLPAILMLTGAPFLFGWAKPVPFNPRNLNDIRRDPVLIALSGPGSNLLLALFAVVLLRIGVEVGLTPSMPLSRILGGLIMINLVLMAFNIIPVPPLDGHHVLYYFLPASGQKVLEQIGPFGILIAIVVARPWLGFVMTAMITGINAFFPGHFLIRALNML